MIHWLLRLAITIAIASAALSAQTGGTPWTTPTPAEVDAIYPDIEALYIDLHRNPELGIPGDADGRQAGRARRRRSGSTSPPASAAPVSSPS